MQLYFKLFLFCSVRMSLAHCECVLSGGEKITENVEINVKKCEETKKYGYYLYYISIYHQFSSVKKKALWWLTSKQNYFFINVALAMTAQVNSIYL
jgi:hypothetical protein